MVALGNGIDALVFLGDFLKQTQVEIMVKYSMKHPNAPKQAIISTRAFTLLYSLELAWKKLQLVQHFVSCQLVEAWVRLFQPFESLIVSVALHREDFWGMNVWHSFVFLISRKLFWLLSTMSGEDRNLAN